MYLTSTVLSQLSLQHGFCRRFGGLSLPPYESLNFGVKTGDAPERVEANLRLLGQRLGVEPKRFYWAAQKSLDAIVEMRPGDDVERIRATPADAIIAHVPTGTPSPLLCIKTADCLPVLLASPQARYLATVHVGWNGALLQLLTKCIAQLEQRGVSPASLHMALGPAIGPCCLRLTGEVKSRFLAAFPKSSAFQFRGKGVPETQEALWLDLWEHSRQAALAAGLKAENITISNNCTVCGPRWFFSHRRDGAVTGRQLSFVGFADGH